MSEPPSHFELSWLGDPVASRVAPHRAGIDDLPWGSLDTTRFSAPILDQARVAWTVSAHQEWCAAAAFAALLRAMLEARAPLDLIGMTSGFVADEIAHTELNARLAMEVGGGAPVKVDPTALVPEVAPDLEPIEHACTLGIAVSCVGETFSLPMLAGTRAVATEPVIRAVLDRIVKDEAPHGKVGWILLDWALPQLGPDARERLARAAERATSGLEDELMGPSDEDLATAGMDEEVLNALGWMRPSAYRRLAQHVVRTRIVHPLRNRGLHVEMPAY